MGPPAATLTSYTWNTGVGCVAPRAFSSSVKLFACIPSEKPETKARPDTWLPPCFGTMFMVRPAVSDSPRPPDVIIVTSCALPMSATKFGGWLPPGGLLTFRPSTVRRDSTPRPPWIGKIAKTGPVLTLLLFVCSPGTVVSR